MLFCAIEIKWRHILTIRHCFNSISCSTNTNKAFYMRIPWRYILVPNWPIKSISKTKRTIEFKIAPSLTCPSPRERLPSYLVTAYPVERFFLHIWMIFILNEKVRGLVPISCRFADERILFQNLFGYITPGLEFPWRL